MNLHLTKHIRKRMRQREIPENYIRETIAQADEREPTYKGRHLARKQFHGKILEVVYASLEGKFILITAYWEEK